MPPKPFICPVCEGSGKYEEQPCHGCSGTGWITIDVEEAGTTPKGLRSRTVIYTIGIGIDQFCPVCDRHVAVGVCPMAEKKRPPEMLLPCGDKVKIVYEEVD